jgi:CubicO group peptidase (beta-lactamase class C family)
MKLSQRLGLITLTALLTTTALTMATPPPGPPDPDAIRASTDTIAQAWLAKRGAVGLSIYIAKDDQILVSRGYGLADLEWRIPVDEDTIFRVCSISKQFEAAAVLRLAEQRKLSLDDDFRRYLPEFPAKASVITIRNLLSQTSGLPSYTDAPGFDDTHGFGGIDHTKTLSHEEALAPVKDKPLNFEPGSRFQYSNTNSYLVGMLIERVAAQPYAQVFHDELAAPASLTRTSYYDGMEVLHKRAHGYQFVDGRLVHEPGPLWTNAYAGGAIVSTAKELVQWNLALTSGRVMSKDSYALLITPFQLKDGKASPYALNWWIDDLGGHRRFWHSGHGQSFTALLAFFPDDHLTIAVLSNSNAIEAPEVARDLARAALNIDVPAPTEVAVPAEAMRSLAGTYSLGPAPDAPTVELTFENGRLVGDDGTHPPERLISIGNGTFVFASDPTIRTTFAAPRDSEPASFTLDNNGRVTRWLRRNRKP